MNAYRVKGTVNKVQLLEMTTDGRVKLKNLATNEVFETSKQAFEMAFEPTDYSILDFGTAKSQAVNDQITEAEIDTMIEKAEVKIKDFFGNCTIVAVQLPNGFILTESTTSMDPKNYDKEENTQICLERIKARIWELERYKYLSLLADSKK